MSVVPPYLALREVAALLGCSRHALARRVELCELPTLHLGPHSRRIESWAVLAGAPDVWPPGRSWTLMELARWWHVHPRTLTKITDLTDLLRDGRMDRRSLVRWVIDHTTGPDLP